VLVRELQLISLLLLLKTGYWDWVIRLGFRE
jgi:hypothetical protein